MAHWVTCPICGKKFDRDKEAVVPYGKRRYAHAKCAENPEMAKVQTITDQDSDPNSKYYHWIMDLVNDFYGSDANYPLIQQQLKKYLKEGMTYQGIYRALKYQFSINPNPEVEKSRGAIGIVPFVYGDGNKYYSQLEQAAVYNLNKNLKNESKVITIKPPKPSVIQMRLIDLDD